MLVVTVLLQVAVSCKRDPSTPNDGNIQLSVLSNAVTANYDDTSFNILINSNSYWVAESDEPWCTLNNKVGRNSATISASFSENNTQWARVANITISNGFGDYQTVTITQNGLSVTDIDGNIYKIVKIGTQMWMAENLKVTRYRNGDLIPNEAYGTVWSSITTGAYCYYDNDVNYSTTYGHLYNWYAATDSRGIAPIGWHIPTDSEWTVLTNYLGGESIAGGKLKQAGYNHWSTPNTGATNESGFNALPGGYRYTNGGFNYAGVSGYWWSRTYYTTANAWCRDMSFNYSNVKSYGSNRSSGLSIRCVKD
jgi:uncharacterized protein (TIGR02145 family)